jgi:lipopolysaccharide export system protein LptA
MSLANLRLVLCAAWLAVAAGALAQKPDARQPIHIEADALRHDDLQQVSVFSGNVVVTRGNVVVRGARIEVRQDPQGYQYGVVTAEPGKLAAFRQRREGNEVVEGEGEVIEYDGRADLFKLIRRAQLRRLRDGQLADVITGETIQYDSLRDVFTVDRASQPGGERVRATLTPRNEAPATAPSAPRGTPLRLQEPTGGRP